MYETDYTTGSGTGASSTAKETAKQASGSAKQAAGEVTDTVKEQGRQVAGEVGAQARSVASDVRQSVAGQVRTGHGKMAESVRKFADELGGMGGDANSPAGQLVSRVSATGRRAADYLDERGPEGLLSDVQSFARRKPGTFLLAAAAAGFVIGRIGRSTMAATQSDDTTVSGTQPVGTEGLYASTGYDAAPTFVEDQYATPSYATGVPGGSAVGTASVDPTVDPVRYDESGYPVDPVSVPQRGTSL